MDDEKRDPHIYQNHKFSSIVNRRIARLQRHAFAPSQEVVSRGVRTRAMYVHWLPHQRSRKPIKYQSNSFLCFIPDSK